MARRKARYITRYVKKRVGGGRKWGFPGLLDVGGAMGSALALGVDVALRESVPKAMSGNWGDAAQHTIHVVGMRASNPTTLGAAILAGVLPSVAKGVARKLLGVKIPRWL